jgi:two-component system chemotaxis response regulator CheB
MTFVSTCQIIVIGGSWGGTEAVIEILSGLPTGYLIPIVVVLHRQKNAESLLPEIIAQHVSLEVTEVNEKEAVIGGKVYLAPANYHVLIEEDRTFSLDVSENVVYSRPSIDVLFESAAMVYKEKLVGILLTGANSDGTEGLQAISEKGGMTIVQHPEEAEHNTMPLAALQKVEASVMTKLQIQKFLLTLS